MYLGTGSDTENAGKQLNNNGIDLDSFMANRVAQKNQKYRNRDEEDDDDEYEGSDDGCDDDIDSRAHFVNTHSHGGPGNSNMGGSYAHSNASNADEPGNNTPLKVGVKRNKSNKKVIGKLHSFVTFLWLAFLTPIRFVMLMCMRSDPDNIFKGKRSGLGLEKNLAMSIPIDLQRIKNLGKKMKASVNDVVLACAGLAMRLVTLQILTRPPP